MLSDEPIDFFAGFGDIALTKQNGFYVTNADKTFIQILHTGSTHWNLNLNRNRAHNDCREVYDRLNSGNITAKVSDEAANMLCCRKPEIRVLVKSVQQQRNYIDCGVFAIAFTNSLGFEDRPEEIIYDSKVMHQHLLNCLGNKRMEHFPMQNGSTIQPCKRKT